MLFNAFKSREKDLVLTLYKTYIRPQVEFSQPLNQWSPYLKKDIDKLESVQHKITRQRGDLIQTFKVPTVYDKVDFDIPIELTPSLNQAGSAGNLRGHKLRIEQELVKNSEQRKQFLLNRVQDAWNNLSMTVKLHQSIVSM